MRFGAIHAHRTEYPVAWMCVRLEVSRSGYYAWRKRPLCARKQQDARLKLLVRVVHAQSRSTYGSPRIHHALRKQGHRVSRKRVARLMRQEGLQGLRKRRFVRTTNASHGLTVAANILERRFNPRFLNRAWVGDMTYLRSQEGWLYLATVIDLCSRRVIGWCIDETLDASLATRALESAARQRRPRPGLIFHSDRGSQYASAGFQAVLKKWGMVCSMSRTGECWDNAVAESFFSRLKDELLYRRSWNSKREFRNAVAEYVTCFYNYARSHSSLGYQTPVEYEAARFAA